MVSFLAGIWAGMFSGGEVRSSMDLVRFFITIGADEIFDEFIDVDAHENGVKRLEKFHAKSVPVCDFVKKMDFVLNLVSADGAGSIVH